jgi:hypothetical protein
LQSAASLAQSRLREGAVVELHIGHDMFELRGQADAVTVRASPSAGSPTATVRLDEQTFYGLASSRLSTDQAAAKVAIEGSHEDARELLAMLAGSAP